MTAKIIFAWSFYTDDEFIERVSHSGRPELQPAIHYCMSDWGA